MDITASILGFINKYYINPIYNKSGYTIVQEITYGILLFVMVYIFYIACKSLKIEINDKFALTTLFYVILISLLRSMTDAGVLPHTFYTVTPGIVIVLGIYYIFSIILTGYFFKDKYYKYSILMAVLPMLYFGVIFLTNIVYFGTLLQILLIIVIIYGIILYLIDKVDYIKNKLKFDKIDKYAILGQLTDASATAVGIASHGYWEQHPIPRFFMDTFGAYSMIPLKLALVFSVLYVLNHEVDNKNLRNIIKITIMALGFAPGLRNLFRIVMGV
jgi:uncharacterized membrane protein